MSFELRARAAAATLEVVFGFNPGQRRGPDGRWIKMGGAGSAGGKRRSGGRNAGEDPLYRQRRNTYNDQVFEYADKLGLANGRDEFARLYREARAATPGPEQDAAIDALRDALYEYIRDPSMPQPPSATTPTGSGRGGERPGSDASYAKRRTALARSIRSGAVSERMLAQGAMGETRRFDLADGTSAVYKRSLRDWTPYPGRPAFTKKDQADAEELSAQVAAAIGALAPAVSRAGEDEVYMELVEGQTAADFWPHRDGSVPRGVLAGQDAIRIGLLDVLIENADRHSGNYLVDSQERLHPIDHGMAFSRTYRDGMNGGPPTRRDTSTVELISPFALEHFSSPSGNYYDENPLSANDVKKARRALARLRPRFEAAGQSGWFESMMERFEHVARRAAGTEDAL